VTWFFPPQGGIDESKVETVMSFDPGGDTGVALLHRPTRVRSATTLDEDNHMMQLWSLLHEHTPDLIICEEFTSLHPDFKHAVEIISRDYIGIIKLYAQKYGVPLFMSALANKKFWSNDKLKRMNWEASTPHAKDAIRHLLWYETFKREPKDQYWLNRLRD